MRNGDSALSPGQAAPLLHHQRSQARGSLAFEVPAAVQPFDYMAASQLPQYRLGSMPPRVAGSTPLEHLRGLGRLF